MYALFMSLKAVRVLISSHEAGHPFTAHELSVGDDEKEIWVRFKTNPQRFLPKVFEGDWAHTKQHPNIGVIRVVRVMTGADGITRVIGRQGNNLYASPWFS